MGRLLALLDGSAYAQSVCDHAAWLAGKTDAEVHLLHVIGRRETSSNPMNLSGNIGLGARSSLLEELADLDAQKAKLAQKRGRAILEDGHARLSAAGAEIGGEHLRQGDLLEAVSEMETDVDFLVIGKRGEGTDFAKGHLGSNLERVVRASHSPVLVSSRGFKTVTKILIAYDGGKSSKAAIQYLIKTRLFDGVDCRLVSAGMTDATSDASVAALISQMDAADVKADFKRRNGSAEDGIRDEALEWGADMIVMGAYSHSRLRSLFLGSTTTELMRSCKLPLLLFR